MNENPVTILDNFRRSGELTRRKLREYFPAMMMTNLSTLLLLTVDGLVAGNLIGPDALSSINIFQPVTVLTGAFSALAATGIATAISTAMGRNDLDELDWIKGASLRLMLIMAVTAGIVQIPIAWLLISSYGLSSEMMDLTVRYAIGVLMVTPLGLISTVGTYQLQIAGKMKALTVLSVMEGLSNLFFDLLFMGWLDLGIAGAGYGTACANVIRCTATVIYIHRRTDMYRSSHRGISPDRAKHILGYGTPDAAYSLTVALRNYLFMRIILAAFGPAGGTIRGVCAFCFNLAYVMTGGVCGSLRPLVGLLCGAEDREGLRILIKQGTRLNLALAGLSVTIIAVWPQWFYTLHGVHEIPEGGTLSLRLFALYFIPQSLDLMFRMYFSNRKDTRLASLLAAAGNLSLPVFAFILWKMTPAPFVFLAYLAAELMVFVPSVIKYRSWLEKDRKEVEENGEDITLYMTVKPEEAIEASRQLRNIADENGISKRISYRAALCMEEMVAYARAAHATGLLGELVRETGKEDLIMDRIPRSFTVNIIVRFTGKDRAVFVEMDDGKFIALDRNEETQKLITDNYGLLRKIAESIEYQYILNMNYTKIMLGGEPSERPE